MNQQNPKAPHPKQTFDLRIFDNKESVEAHVQTLIEKRSKIQNTHNPKFTVECLAQTRAIHSQKSLLTQQIWTLSELAELEY